MKSSDPTPLASTLTGSSGTLFGRDMMRRWGLGVLALGLILYAYGINQTCLFQVTPTSLFGWLWATWGHGADNAHGYLVPLVSVGVFYWKWQSTLRNLPMESSRWGLVLVGLAMLLYIIGVRGQQKHIVAISLIVLLFGVIFYLGGWPWAKAAWFPCAFLIFMIPLSILDPWVGFRLRMFVAQTSGVLLNMIGLNVKIIGTGIHSETGRFLPLEVADPCSGIRSLTALMALTALYGYIAMHETWKKWVLFSSSIPLAVIGNLARITTVALVAQGFGSESAMKIYHDFSGYIIFILAILCMLGLGTLLNLHYRDLMAHWLQEEEPPRPELAKRR